MGKEREVKQAAIAGAAREERTEVHRVVWKGEIIEFVIRRGSPRRRRTAIRVTREGEVQVLLPPRAAGMQAFAAVTSRGDWIARHLRDVKSRPPVRPPAYAAGEEHLVWGECYRLELALPGGDAFFPDGERAVLEDDAAKRMLRLRVRSADAETVRRQLFLWYREEIARRIAQRMDALCPSIPWLAVPPVWRGRVMRRRWGSCTGNGVLTLNTQLVKAPPRCLDYVLLHEIAHLREHNHSKRYYAVLDRLLPEWKEVRRELERWAPLILA